MKYFLEMAASQHVTRSAEKLHIAQPALTQAIHRLEKELNVPLFVSRGRNIAVSYTHLPGTASTAFVPPRTYSRVP